MASPRRIAFHHRDLDDVIVTGFSSQYAGLLGKILVHRLYVTHAQEAHQAGLPRAAWDFL
jgi:hypothetical protein